MTTLPAFDGVIAENPHLSGVSQAYLPTSQAENHASFLTWLDEDTLACVWFAGSREARPDASIYFSQLKISSGQWSDPIKVSDDDTRSEQNPVLSVLPDGRLWLLYTAQEMGAQDTAIIKQQFSDNCGATWSRPEIFDAPPQTFLRQPMLIIDDEWILPIFICTILPGRAWHGDADVSAVLVSKDQGQTWDYQEVPNSTGAVHMNIVRGAKNLVGLYRSRWADYVYRSQFDASTGTWSEPAPTPLPNNNSSIQAIDGEIAGKHALFLVSNPLGQPPTKHLGDRTTFHNAGKRIAPGEAVPLKRHAEGGPTRIPLSLLVSVDDGLTWHKLFDLETPETISPALAITEGRKKDEMSYPAIVRTEQGDLHITYSYARRTIKHQVFPRDVVESRFAEVTK